MFFHTERLNLISELDDVKKAEYALLGVPFDATETDIPGQRLAPNEIRKCLLSLEMDNLSKKIYDMGNLVVAPGNVKATLKKIEETLNDLFLQNPNVVPIILGGEHTITYTAIKALNAKHKDLQVLVFDAHYDLKNDYLGEKFTHSTVMRRMFETNKNLTIIGCRAGSADEKKFYEKNIRKDLKKIDKKKPLYVSIDIDVLDPSLVKGVGNPEPNGFGYDKLFKLISLINSYKLVGFDIVEANPLIENKITPLVAAKCLLGLTR